MALRSECQNGLCDACFHFDADSCSDGRSLLRQRKELAFKFEWEERVGLCTTEQVMFEVAMECHGNRFRTSDHSTVSLEPLKETLFNSAQVQLPTAR